MGATIDDIKTLTLCILAGLGGLLKYVLVVGLVLYLPGATINVETLSAENHVVANADHPADPSHETVVCVDSIVCTPYSLSIATESLFLDQPGVLQVVSREYPFLRFLSPLVDLPPPRYAA